MAEFPAGLDVCEYNRALCQTDGCHGDLEALLHFHFCLSLFAEVLILLESFQQLILNSIVVLYHSFMLRSQLVLSF